MEILILGGTLFLGRHLVEAARHRGHSVTLFNRGKTNPQLFADVETLVGDRDGELGALRGRSWDAVVDTSGYLPRVVGASARLLADVVEHYTFVSSISVYAEPDPQGVDEDARLEILADEGTEEIAAAYGGLKAACERVVEEHLPGRTLAVRAGLLIGPYDPTGRFTYWPRRVAEGGDVLAPGRPARPIQLIHARDVADWIVRMAEARRAGVYNVTGPAHTLTMGEMLETCRTVAVSDVRFTWVSEQFLLDAGVAPFTELPLWVPEAMNGLMRAKIDRAVAAGLTFRPLAQTVAETLAWASSQEESGRGTARGASGPLGPIGLAPTREQELLAAWRASR